MQPHLNNALTSSCLFFCSSSRVSYRSVSHEWRGHTANHIISKWKLCYWAILSLAYWVCWTYWANAWTVERCLLSCFSSGLRSFCELSDTLSAVNLDCTGIHCNCIVLRLLWPQGEHSCWPPWRNFSEPLRPSVDKIGTVISAERAQQDLK